MTVVMGHRCITPRQFDSQLRLSPLISSVGLHGIIHLNPRPRFISSSSKHLRQTHQPTHTLRQPLPSTPSTLHATQSTPRRARTTQRTRHTMRQPQPNHRQQLRQHPTRQQRQNNQQKHLHRMTTRVAVNIPEKLLDRVNHALDETLARTGPARRRRE